MLVGAGSVACLRTELSPQTDGSLSYPSLTPDVPAAFWYERALHDLSGVVPTGHPRLDPCCCPANPGNPGRALDMPNKRPLNGTSTPARQSSMGPSTSEVAACSRCRSGRCARGCSNRSNFSSKRPARTSRI
ncbi:respiratory-chain NADH dehydrogenase, 30 Kd subunit [Mycobacterium xenopi 3993]|nr:respiratory-chain NADH dehydrogenase, 30 Kd subunit [Mycobacterium xenopi 3993]